MANVSTTKMSSKGQVVTPPSLDDLSDLISEARKKGKQAGIKKSDISNAILKARE